MKHPRLLPLLLLLPAFAPGVLRADCTGCSTISVGGDEVHIFTASGGTFTPPAGVTQVRYLVVAGGGGGGGLPAAGNLGGGGGGGAGGYRAATGFAVTPLTAYPITVGTGGVAGVGGTNDGGTGGNSVFSTITSLGGGGGASNPLGNNGNNGGSGGGPRLTGTPGTGTVGQGNNAGNGSGTGGAGGGGGSGGVGGSTGGAGAGAGGASTSNDITGVAVNYAAGGAGGSYGTRAAGASGAANTGNGGVGASGANGGIAVNGGAGGSGIVIIRYTPPLGRFAVATGNWSATSTWSSSSCAGAAGASVPANGSDVTICATRTVTLNTNSANLGSLTIQNTGVLDIGNDGTARTLTSAGAVSNAGTLRYNTAAAHAANFASTLSNSGTLTTAAVAGNKTLSVTGLITNSGTVELAGNGVFTANANGGLTNSGNLSFTTAQNHLLNVTGGLSNTGTITASAVGGTKTVTVSGLTTNSGNFLLAGDGAFTLNANGGLTNNSTLSFNSAQNHAVNVTGAFTNSGTGTVTAAAVGGTKTITVSGLTSNAGTFQLAGNAVFTLNANGGLNNSNSMSFTSAQAHAVNVTGAFNNSGTFTSSAVGGARTVTVSGLLTNTGTFRFAGSAPMTVNANGGISNGNVLDVLNSSNVTHTLIVGADFSNNGTVNFTPDADSLVDVTFNGGAAQTLSGSAGSTTFNNVILNNANGLALGGTHNAVINNTLTLTAGRVTTGTNYVHLVSGNAVAGAGANTFVVGNLRKRYTATGSVTRSFEVGSTTGGVLYAPVSVQLGDVTGTGDFTVSTTAGDHPNIGTSTILGTLSINRYWTLAADSVSFAAHAGNTVIFNFNNPADYDVAADFNVFYASRYNAPNWSEITPSARTATSVTLSGTGLAQATIGGDYQLGERTEPLPAELADYRMEQSAWSGAANEVVDSSGNNRHGTSSGGPTTSNASPAIAGEPGTCRYGQFDGNDDYIQVNNLSSILNATASLAFWIRTTQVGNNTGWQAPGISGVELGGGSDDIFWGWIDASGNIGVSVANDFTTKSSTPINDGNWHHVVLTRNHIAGSYRIYIDGALNASGSIATGTIGTAFSSIGRIEDTDGTPEEFAGDLDEVRIYGSVLSLGQVIALMNETHSCFTPFAYYPMDEDDWSAGGSILDSIGSNHASAQNGVVPDPYPVSSPPDEAVSGDPGTCGAADVPLNSDNTEVAITTPIQPDGDIGSTGTIAFWYSHDNNWNDGNDRMLLDASQNLGNGGADKHFYLVKRGSGTNGGLRFAIEDSGDTDLTANTGAYTFAADTWHHVAVTWNLSVGGANDRVRIFVDGVQDAQGTANSNAVLGNTTTLYFADNRGDGGIAGTPGNYTQNSANGYLDEIRIYTDELPQAAITALMSDTHPCSAGGPHHFAVIHDGTAVNCQAEPVTIEAHDVSHNVDISYTGTVTLATTTAHGDWLQGGAANPVGNLGNGAATYTFDVGDAGAAALELKSTFVETTNIDVADNLVTELGSEDPDLAFAETGFIFLGNSAPDNIGVQIAGKDSNVAPGAQTLELQAVRTSNDTGACEAALVGPNSIELRLAYVNPGTGTQDIDVNGTPVGTGYTAVSLDFGDATDTTATIVLNYPDAGQVRLDARYDIPLDGGGPSGNLMLGSSNDFVVKPAGICVETADANADCAAGDSSCSAFTAAGATFNLDISAVGWETAGEADADFCSGNPVTQNFRLDDIVLGAVLVAPAAGANATLGMSSIDMVAADNGTHQIVNQQSVSEVGVFRIEATPPAYFGESIAASESANIGRFTPARLEVSANTPEFAHGCGGGAEPFTYMDQPFHFGTAPVLTVTGLNAGGGTTLNYGGEGTGGSDFWRLASVLINRSYDDPLRPAFGHVNGSNATLGSAADYDGDGELALASGSGGDDFMYARNAAPEAPFNAEVDALFPAGDLTDDDGICYDPEQDSTCNAFSIDDITGTGAGTEQLRFGRLVIGTAAGSELLPLAVPLRAEYFDGTAFGQNTDDACTGIAANELILSSAVEGAQTDGDVQVAAGGTTTATVANDPLLQGSAGLSFSAPGENFTGYADITVDLGSGGLDQDWLRFDWDGDGGHDEDPVGRASFGIFRGNDRLIYTREPWN